MSRTLQASPTEPTGTLTIQSTHHRVKREIEYDMEREIQINGKNYTFVIDALNGEAKVFDEDYDQVDTVDLWDLAVQFDEAADKRTRDCIIQSAKMYENGFRVSND